MIKEKFYNEKLFSKVGKFFSAVPLSPNQWTVFTLLIAVGAFYLVISGNVLLGAAVFYLAAVADGIDGCVARYLGGSTHFGAFFDGTIDRFVDFLLIYSFMFLRLPPFLLPIEHWIVIAVFVAIMPSFVVAYANHRRAVDDPEEKVIWRILHRFEMYTLFTVALVLAAFRPLYATYFFVFATLLSLVTTIQSIVLVVIKSSHH